MTISGTINSVIDDVQGVAASPMIKLIGLVFPQANSVIDIIRQYAPLIDAAQPIITAAVDAGEPVFDKVIEQLPAFSKVVTSVVALMPAIRTPGAAAATVENIARVIGGHSSMTFDEEVRWMAATTPGNDPSQENSKYPVG